MEAIKLLDNNSNKQKASFGPKTTSSQALDHTLRGNSYRHPRPPNPIPNEPSPQKFPRQWECYALAFSEQ